LEKYTVTGFRTSIQERGIALASDFMDMARDILDSSRFLELESCVHHVDISRRQHCINVAYIAFAAARILGLDSRSALRAGLMHDLFYYNYKDSDLGLKHSYVHPLQALKNAEELGELSEKEREIIKYHMWPLCDGVPRHPETYLISIVDKCCAAIEVADYMVRLLRRLYRRYFARA
jgi:uncharacterized protein